MGGLEEDIVSDPSRDLQAAFYGVSGLVSMQEGKEEGKGWPGRFFFLFPFSFFLFAFTLLGLVWVRELGVVAGRGIGRGVDRCQLFFPLFLFAFYLLFLHLLDLLVCCQFLGSQYGVEEEEEEDAGMRRS